MNAYLKFSLDFSRANLYFVVNVEVFFVFNSMRQSIFLTINLNQFVIKAI